MILKLSDRLKLRVDALGARLGEVSAELSACNGAAYQVRERLHSVTAEALVQGLPQPPEAAELRRELSRQETAVAGLAEQEEQLKRLHFAARRDHLAQLRKDHPGRWLVLD
jgi:hypothetical protein